MMKKRIRSKLRYVACVASLVSACMVLSGAAAGAQEGDAAGITIREVSVEDSLQGLLEENKTLKAEKQDLQAELDRLETRFSMYARRVTRLNGAIDELEQQMEDQRDASQAEQERLQAELATLAEEKKALEKKIAAFDALVMQDVYFAKWEEADAKLQEANIKMQELTVINERLREENGKVHYNLGNIFFERRDYENAAYEYEQAMRLLPDDPDIYYNLALLYDAHLKDSKKALEYYDKYLQKSADPKRPLAIKERMAENEFLVQWAEAGK